MKLDHINMEYTSCLNEISSARSLMSGAMGGFSLDATDGNNFARLGCQGTYDK